MYLSVILTVTFNFLELYSNGVTSIIIIILNYYRIIIELLYNYNSYVYNSFSNFKLWGLYDIIACSPSV